MRNSTVVARPHRYAHRASAILERRRFQMRSEPGVVSAFSLDARIPTPPGAVIADERASQGERRQPRYMHVPNCVGRTWTGKVGQYGPRKSAAGHVEQVVSPRRSYGRNGNMGTIQGLRTATTIFIGRWTPMILFSLMRRPYRHGQLRRRLGGVSQRMLTRTLRDLESAGLIARRVTGSRAVAVEYSLTQLGMTIIVPLEGMCHWARRHGRHVRADVPLSETHETQ